MSRKIHIVCLSGSLEKLQMAAMVASVGAASGDEVTVFFSMNALAYFIRDEEKEAPVEGSFGMLLHTNGVPPFKHLFQQAAELGDAQLLPCSMALDLLEITDDDLAPGFGKATGLTKFLMDAEDAQLLSF